MTGWNIAVPAELGDKQLVSFFRGWQWLDDPPSPVTMDFSQVKFIAPWAATLFAAYGVWLREVRSKEVQVWIDEGTSAGAFLSRCGLRQVITGDAPPSSSAKGDRLLPFTRIRTSAEIPAYAANVMKVLAIDDDEVAGAIKYSLVELLRNVVQHAKSRIGGLALATYFPSAGITDFVVADIGCGIRASLRGRYPDATTDLKGIRFAVQPHVSSTFSGGQYSSMLNNAGLGLFFIKEIVSRGCGGLFLGSGEALADYWGNMDGSPGKLYAGSKADGGGWRGTFALVQLRRDKIADFDALLQRCREIAAAVRKDPTELKLDFVDEVPAIDGLKVIRISEFEEDVERAADIRDRILVPTLEARDLVVLDFDGVKFATQSFVHACLYRVLRDVPSVVSCLSIARASGATEEAIRAVAAYAAVGHGD